MLSAAAFVGIFQIFEIPKSLQPIITANPIGVALRLYASPSVAPSISPATSNSRSAARAASLFKFTCTYSTYIHQWLTLGNSLFTKFGKIGLIKALYQRE